MVGPGLHAWLCVGADLDPPFLYLGLMPSPQGAFGLGPRLSKRRDASLVSRFSGPQNRPQPLTGKGGSSPHCRASREKRCGAYIIISRIVNNDLQKIGELLYNSATFIYKH